jgi:hypothetical protein
MIDEWEEWQIHPQETIVLGDKERIEQIKKTIEWHKRILKGLEELKEKRKKKPKNSTFLSTLYKKKRLFNRKENTRCNQYHG